MVQWTASGLVCTQKDRVFNQFDGPYASHAHFKAGELSGRWVIEDRRGQKIFEMPYKDGRRNGVAVWYLPQGKIYRRMEFNKDVTVGNLVEYDNLGKIRRKEIYKDGMKIVNNVTYYRPSGQKRQESIVQQGRLELQGADDWWEAQPAPMVVTGEDVQHGPIRSWYENGQTKMVGNLVQGTRVGKFIWWHSKGTKQLVGQYDKSGKKTGRWRWWHESGRKSIDGSYTNGKPDGPWQWWDEDGELINEEDFDPDADEDDTSISIDMSDDSSEDSSDASLEEDTSIDELMDETPRKNSKDPFGEDIDLDKDFNKNEDSILELNETGFESSTDALEGIEPESFDGEEIPEPDTARRMPASLKDRDADAEVETFFRIRDEQ